MRRAASARSSPLRLSTSAGVAWSRRRGQRREHLLGARHLRDELGVTKLAASTRGSPVAASRVHSSARVAGSRVDLVVLQAVARPDVAEEHRHGVAIVAGRGAGSVLAVERDETAREQLAEACHGVGDGLEEGRSSGIAAEQRLEPGRVDGAGMRTRRRSSKSSRPAKSGAAAAIAAMISSIPPPARQVVHGGASRAARAAATNHRAASARTGAGNVPPKGIWYGWPAAAASIAVVGADVRPWSRRGRRRVRAKADAGHAVLGRVDGGGALVGELVDAVERAGVPSIRLASPASEAAIERGVDDGASGRARRERPRTR